MDCRTFRERYSAFVDESMSDAELVAMEAHRGECTVCARYDTAVRRGLLVLRNLPALEPSAHFRERLNDRLTHVKRADARAELYRGPGLGAFITVAAGVLAAGFLAASVFDVAHAPRELRLSPVVAMRPAPPPPPVVTSVFVASASAGVPVWPAAMMAQQVPVHYVSASLEGTSTR